MITNCVACDRLRTFYGTAGRSACRRVLVLALAATISQCSPSSAGLRAAEIVGPRLTQKNAGDTTVTQGNPPLIRLSVRGDDGRPLSGKIVRWCGRIGESQLARECGDGLTVSTAVVGRFEFLAVIVPASVAAPADIEIVRHVVVVSPPPAAPPPGNPPPDDPVPVPPTSDLSARARQWLSTVPVEARERRADVAKTLREIATSTSLKSIDEMELFLGVGLAWSIGTDAQAWASFSASANAALDQLKSKSATRDQYAAALLSIAEGISQ